MKTLHPVGFGLSLAGAFLGMVLIAGNAWAGPVHADTLQLVPTVAKGSDYLQTQAGSFFNFGGPIGVVQFVGNPTGPGFTDTIIQRKEDAVINNSRPGGDPNPGPNPIDIQMTDLSMKNAAPVNIGGSFFDVFVTLDPSHLADDVGNMTIYGNTSGGTFDSNLNVFFDAHFVPLGPGSAFDVFGNTSLTQQGAAWSPTPSPGTQLVTGPDDGSAADQAANLHLGLSSDPNEVDFFAFTVPPGGVSDSGALLPGQGPFGPFKFGEDKPEGDGVHNVDPAPAPEPSTIILLGIGGIGLVCRVRRRKAKDVA